MTAIRAVGRNSAWRTLAHKFHGHGQSPWPARLRRHRSLQPLSYPQVHRFEPHSMGTLLRYPYEVRSAEIFRRHPGRQGHQGHARSRQAHRQPEAGHFEPDKFEDQYETALVDLINQKRAGKPITAKERPRGENVVDLMDACVKASGPRTRARMSSRPRSRARSRAAKRKC
jgi:non-homologous end joining protein Ku